MNWRARLTMLAALGIAFGGCTSTNQPVASTPTGRFASDLAFLRAHTEIVLLTDPSGAQVAVAPTYQGRVMTSTIGEYRSKIGLPPSRALSIAGSYSASEQVLTLVEYTRPAEAGRYVNSMWEIQREPYKGDVINSYNDGPPAPGEPPLGPFYELETSSPALDLAPGRHYTHVHRTFHLVGPPAELDRLARATLGVGLAALNVFAPPTPTTAR